jgi:hypothetical protein
MVKRHIKGLIKGLQPKNEKNEYKNENKGLHEKRILKWI